MAELDIKASAGPFSAELDLVASAVQKGFAEAAKAWRRAGGPLDKRVDFSGTVSAGQAGLATPTAFFTFSPDGPQQGRLWSIRKIVIQASTSTAFSATALSNVEAVVFVTGQTNNPPLQDAHVTNLPVPTTQFFSSHQLWIRNTDSLVVGIQGTGVTAGVQVFGHANVLEIDDDPTFLLDL